MRAKVAGFLMKNVARERKKVEIERDRQSEKKMLSEDVCWNCRIINKMSLKKEGERGKRDGEIEREKKTEI